MGELRDALEKQGFDNRIRRLEGIISTLEEELSALKIDHQMLVKGKKIHPGSGCKVFYNTDGLIIGAQQLTDKDIPQLPISKIKDLETRISQLASKEELNEIKQQLEGMYDHTETTKTGTKVNVDKHGFVNDTTDLTSEDIPELPIDKIAGLRNELESLKQSPVQNMPIKAERAIALYYDKNTGRVLGPAQLEFADLPQELYQKLMTLYNMVGNKVDQSELTQFMAKIEPFIPTAIPESGAFYGVLIDDCGHISGIHRKLRPEDIPELPMSHIFGLESSFSEFDHIQQTLTVLTNKIDALSNHQPPAPIVQVPSTDIQELKQLLNKVMSDKSVNDELMSLKSIISELSKRIDQLENSK